MNNPIQNINAIAPVAGGLQNSASADPAQAEYSQGKALLERNELGPAAVALHNALLGFEEQNNEGGVANASNQLGSLCLLRNEFDAALRHFRRAEEICQRLHDPMSLQALSRQYIRAYTGSGQYKKAIAQCLDLLDVFEANNNPKGVVEIMEQMAEIYLQAGEKKSAADAYKTIASIHNNFKHKNIAAQFLEKAQHIEEGA
jgi:tetratricopeptide (TPR) repeat protein